MAPHAKYLAIYDSPFWRDQGMSGEARSGLGPMAEIHDASMPDGSAGLFGFIGVPAIARRGATLDTLKALCRNQLVRLFGPGAATPKSDFIQDWAQEPETATPADLEDGGEHIQDAPPILPLDTPWNACLAGAASEWSPRFPGYVAGAIDAATRAINALLSSRQTTRHT